MMQAMKTSIWLDRVGHGVVNGALLISLPAAALAMILQSL